MIARLFRSPVRHAANHTAPDESDVALALFRSAFVVAFSVTASASGTGREAMVAWTGVGLGVAYTLVVFAVWWRQRAPVVCQRPASLLVDIILVSSIIASYGYAGSGVKDCYYVIIFAAGMWFRLAGAVIVGVLACAAYVFAYGYGTGLSLSPASAVRVIYESGAIFMPAAGFIMGVLFTAYAREMHRLAEIDHEIDLARRLQDDLLPPSPPELPGWEIAAAMKRARQVGGDLYTFHTYPDGSVLLAMADMAGKSVHGLVHLSLLHSHLRAAVEVTEDLASLAQELNVRAYPELQPDSYAAAVLVRVPPDGGEISYVNCGHLPPLVVTGSGEEPVPLSTGDPIIGAERDHVYREERALVEPGALLVCYTDGLVETRSATGQMYGEERMRRFVREHAHLSPEEMCRALLAQVAEFSEASPHDDQTVVVLRRRPVGQAAQS